MAGVPLARDSGTTYYAERTPDLSKVDGAAAHRRQLGRAGLHTRGNFEGFVALLRSRNGWKCTAARTGRRSTPTTASTLQKRFFDYFLKGEKNGWDKQPRVLLNVRHPGEKFVQRHENEWPLARTQVDAASISASSDLSLSEPERAAREPFRTTRWANGVTFSMPSLKQTTEITGPSALKLFVSSATSDADLFVVLRVFDPDGKEVLFQGALDPQDAGRRRAGCAPRTASSIRRRALPYRPWHTHDEMQKLKPGEVVELDIEIWPTCIVVPAGWPHRAHDPRPRLRARRRRGDALQHEASDEGLRALHPRRSDRPAARGIRRQGDHCTVENKPLPAAADHSGEME